MKNNNNPHIRQLIKMKKMYFKTEDKNVIEIFDKINSYLSNHCEHTMITDLIDIDPDRSKTIQYCTTCNIVFS